MNTVTITLELTPDEVIKVMTVLDTSLEANTATSRPKLSSPDKSSEAIKQSRSEPENASPALVEPTAGKSVKMPLFGRTKEQIDAFAKDEEERLAEKEKKEQDKLDKKIAKDEAAVKATQELAQAKETEQSKVVTMPEKPWIKYAL